MRLIKKVLIRTGLIRKVPAYIHIPKTGGTYLAQLESNVDPVIVPMEYLGHVCVVGSYGNNIFPPKGFTVPRVIHRDELSLYYAVSTVRNPFEFLVSYAGHAGGWNPKYVDKNHYDFENARKGFDYLVRQIADREEPWPSRKLIHFQLFSDKGEFVVDWLNRSETLDADLQKLAELLNLKYQRKGTQREGIHEHYREYYTDTLAELVEKTWARELNMFGYCFDGISQNERIVGTICNKRTKKRLKYYWESDTFYLDEKKFL